MSTTAQIAAKGTNGTGITDEIAKTLHDNLGKTITIVAEIRSESRGETLKGDQTVKLAIQTLEVIPEDAGAADHVRDIADAAFRNRKLAEDGPELDYGDGPAPKVADVLAAGAKHKPHPFLPDDAAKDTPLCDVCGQVEAVAIHADRTALAHPFSTSEASAGDESDDTGSEDEVGTADEPVVLDVDELTAQDLARMVHVHDVTGRCVKNRHGSACEDDQPAPDDPAFEPHAFDGDEGYVCGVCDQPEDAAVHTQDPTAA